MDDSGTVRVVLIGCSLHPWPPEFEGILRKEGKEGCLLRQDVAGFGYLKKNLILGTAVHWNLVLKFPFFGT